MGLPDTDQQYITTQEAAKALGYEDRSVRKLAAEGKLQGAYKRGRGWLIPRTALEAYGGGPSEGVTDTRKTDEPKVAALSESDSLYARRIGHQAFLLDQLVGIKLEVKRFTTNFPTVWDGYRPPSNYLHFVEEGHERRIEWNPPCKQDPGWKFAEQHLQTGLPKALRAFRSVADSYARYSQELVTLEDRYREEVKKIRDGGPGEISINNSEFYRSILNEVDREISEPSRGDYTVAKVEEGYQASYPGSRGQVWLLAAESRSRVEEWIDRHFNWRNQLIVMDKGRILNLRREIQAGANLLVRSIEDVEADGYVPGTC